MNKKGVLLQWTTIVLLALMMTAAIVTTNFAVSYLQKKNVQTLDLQTSAYQLEQETNQFLSTKTEYEGDNILVADLIAISFYDNSLDLNPLIKSFWNDYHVCKKVDGLNSYFLVIHQSISCNTMFSHDRWMPHLTGELIGLQGEIISVGVLQ